MSRTGTSGNISYIAGGRNPKFSVWIHLGVVEFHTLFIDQCVSFMKIYCLWGYFINLWHNSWFCLIINSQTVQFKGIFKGGTTLFSHRRKIELYNWIESRQHPCSMIQGKTNYFTSQSCKPLPYDCTSVWASKYYFQHVFCTCEFNEQRWKHQNTKMYKGPSPSIVRIPQNFLIYTTLDWNFLVTWTKL